MRQSITYGRMQKSTYVFSELDILKALAVVNKIKYSGQIDDTCSATYQFEIYHDPKSSSSDYDDGPLVAELVVKYEYAEKTVETSDEETEKEN